MKAFVSVLLVAAATAQTFDFMGTNKPTYDFGRYGYGNNDLSLAQLLSVTGKTYGTGKVFPWTKTGYYPTRVLTINELMNTQLFQEYLNIPLFRHLVTVPVFQTYLETIKFQQFWTNPTFMNIFRNPVLFYKYIYPTVVTIDTTEYPTVTPFNVPTYDNDVFVNNLVEKIYRTLFINGGVKPEITEVKTDVKVEVETPTNTNVQENMVGKFVDPITGEIKYNNGDFKTVEEKVTPIVTEVKVTKPIVENFFGEDTIKEALLKRPFLNKFFHNKEIPTTRFEIPRTPEMIKMTDLPLDIARIRRDTPALFNTLLNYYKFATEEPTYNKYNNGLYKKIDPVLAIILAHHIYNEVPIKKEFLLNKEYPINKEFLLLNKEYPMTKEALFNKEFTKEFTPFNMETLLKKEYLPFNKDFLLNKEYPVNKEFNKMFLTKEFYPFNKDFLLNKEYPVNKEMLLNKEFNKMFLNKEFNKEYTSFNKEYTPFNMETLLKKEYLPFNKDFVLNKELFPLKKEMIFEKPEEKIFYNTLFNVIKKNILEEMRPTTTDFVKNFEYGMKPEDKYVHIPLTYTPTYKTFGEDKIVPKTIVV